jgi:hypothetical protein
LVVSEEQLTFLTNRNILDGPLIISEVIAWLKRERSSALLFKVDFNKAFDTINCDDSVFEQMGFQAKWRLWIRGILSSSRSAVLVNGSPTREFNYERGVKQGDPLSPFIFILAMEALSSFITSVVKSGAIKGISIPNGGPCLSRYSLLPKLL